MAGNRIEDRKSRDRQARRTQIVSAARRVAEAEGWSSVTVRRLADEIAYSQPVLYSHFENREAILGAVAIEGFQELGAAMENARKRVRRGSPVEAVASAYLQFAVASPALYEVMFSLDLKVSFGQMETPPELRFAFLQFLELFPKEAAEEGAHSQLFPDRSMASEVLAELFWAALHGTAEFSRTHRFPRNRQKNRLSELIKLFTMKPPAAKAHK